MDDIEEVVKRAEHYRFEDSIKEGLLNRASLLPTSKAKLKRSIQERIRLLSGVYISLASFVSDEDADYVAGLHGEQKGKRLLKIFKKVLNETTKLEREMRNFDLFDLP